MTSGLVEVFVVVDWDEDDVAVTSLVLVDGMWNSDGGVYHTISISGTLSFGSARSSDLLSV